MEPSSNNSLDEYQLVQLWLRASEGAASDEDVRQLETYLGTDAAARRCIVELAAQQAWLQWNGLEPLSQTELSTSLADESMSPTSADNIASISPAPGEPNRRARRKRDAAPDETSQSARHYSRYVRFVFEWLVTTPRYLPLFSVLGIAVLGALFVAIVWKMTGLGPQNLAKGSALDGTIQPTNAELRSVTHCVWHPVNPQQEFRSRGLPVGESLELQEGIAELNFQFDDGSVKLELEGPVSLSFGKNGVPSLRYGKITASLDGAASRRFSMEVPFGELSLEPGTEMGVSCFGSSAEMHAFEGALKFSSPWLVPQSDSANNKTVSIEAGQAVVFEGVGTGEVYMGVAEANRGVFAPQIAMSRDDLAVTPEYVSAIKGTKPLAYWRFEQVRDGVVPNEMGEAYAAEVIGTVDLVGTTNSQACQLGFEDESGAIVAQEPWRGVFSKGFALELWYKPSHYHLGALVRMLPIGHPSYINNGALLETCNAFWYSDEHPPRTVHFFHRAADGGMSQQRVNCYGSSPYGIRRWQHLVAQKLGDQLQLYVNGELAGEGLSPVQAEMPEAVQIALGRLGPNNAERSFVGQLDEVAIYDRALTAEEINSHYRILRQKPDVSLETPPQPRKQRIEGLRNRSLRNELLEPRKPPSHGTHDGI